MPTYNAMQTADDAFSASLRAQFGKRAGDVRYGTIRAFNSRTLAACEEFMLACQQHQQRCGNAATAEAYARRVAEIRALQRERELTPKRA